jgi:hypothetical protein
MTAIYKGDDTNAFGQNFIQINLNETAGYNISKVVFNVDLFKKFL